MSQHELHDALARARKTRKSLQGSGATARLENIRVGEISLVTAGANNRNLLLLKRADAMTEIATRADAIRATIAASEAPARHVRLLKESAAMRGDLQYVLGVVLEPDTVDAQGDIYSPDEVRKAAWGYVREQRHVGLQHKTIVDGRAHLVDSFVTPVDLQIGTEFVTAGTWIAGFQIVDADLWAQVKSGRIGGLSMGGWASRVKP